MADRRWSKFWWEDYEGDPLLSACSLAAQGLWMRLLCLMHRGSPYGHLVINSKPPSAKILASVMRCSERELSRLLAELEDHGVFSRTEDSVIFSRRMVKDAGRSEEGAETIKRRWGEAETGASSTRSQRLSAARRKGTHTSDEWLALVEVVGDSCPRCGNPFEDSGPGRPVRDHIIPIYQDGSDAIENIQPLCQRCNSAKGRDRTDYRPQDWSERLKKRLGSLGVSYAPNAYQTPTLEARSKKLEAREERLPPLTSFGAPLRRAERLPSDWELTGERREFAGQCGVNADQTFAAFCDYWHAKVGKDALKMDWDATWRNWCRNEVKHSAKGRDKVRELMDESAKPWPKHFPKVGNA